MDELQVKTLPVLDWHGIWPGYVSHDEAGLYFPQDLPTGVRLAVQQAECSDPVMVRQERWEAGNIHYPSLIKEDDCYRLWYCCFADAEDPWVKTGHVPGKVPALWCYAESADGFHWERPSLGRIEYDGSKDNNILFVCEERGSHYGYMNVMHDPHGSDEERYKAIGITGKFWVDGRLASRAEVMELRAKREAAGDAGEIGANITSQVVVTGGVSPDGLSWTHLSCSIRKTFPPTTQILVNMQFTCVVDASGAGPYRATKHAIFAAPGKTIAWCLRPSPTIRPIGISTPQAIAATRTASTSCSSVLIAGPAI